MLISRRPDLPSPPASRMATVWVRRLQCKVAAHRTQQAAVGNTSLFTGCKLLLCNSRGGGSHRMLTSPVWSQEGPRPACSHSHFCCTSVMQKGCVAHANGGGLGCPGTLQLALGGTHLLDQALESSTACACTCPMPTQCHRNQSHWPRCGQCPACALNQAGFNG